MNIPAQNDHDRQTIREIQQRCGVEPTGELNLKTIYAVHETLGIPHKFFSRFFGTEPQSQTSGSPAPSA